VSPSRLSQAGALVYARRRAEASALHQVVRDNLLTLYGPIEQRLCRPQPVLMDDGSVEREPGASPRLPSALRARPSSASRWRASEPR
jgi:hypothetical protein